MGGESAKLLPGLGIDLFLDRNIYLLLVNISLKEKMYKTAIRSQGTTLGALGVQDEQQMLNSSRSSAKQVV